MRPIYRAGGWIFIVTAALASFASPAVWGQTKPAGGGTPTAGSGQSAPAGPAASGKPGDSSGTSTPAAGAGKRAITITVPDEGEHFVRPLPSPDASEKFPLPIRSLDRKFTVTLDTATLGKSPKLAIDSAKTGNTAVVPLPAGDTVDIKTVDYDHVHRVEVRATYENKPVQTAKVTLATEGAGSAPQVKVIDAAAQGVALFTDVPVGKAKVTLDYGDKLAQTLDVPITTDHPGTSVVITAVAPSRVATLDTPMPGAAGSSSATGASGSTAAPVGVSGPVPPAQTTPPSSSGSFIDLIGKLLGLGLVGAGIYFLYRWSQTGGLAATLKKAGIEVSGPAAPSDAGTPWQPNAPAAPVVSDPSICQFCGQKKDASGNCACTLSGAAINTGPASPAVLTQPRLVATMGVYSGSVFPINGNGAPVTFGREPSNSVPLDNDTTVSRRHAAIRAENGTYMVSDEGSSNGVYVNGVRISGAQPLRPGDEVQIGNTRFRFEL